MILDEVKSAVDALPELLLIDDQMVAGGYHHLGIGIDGFDVVGCPGDAGSGIAACGLEQDLVVLDLRQLFLDEGLVALVSDQDDILNGHNAVDAVKGHLQQGASCAEEIDELFRLGGFGEGPKSAADASAHDNAISVVIHCGGNV